MPLLRFLFAQALSWAIVLAAIRAGVPLAGFALAIAQGTGAALISHLLRAPRWWQYFHAGFSTLVWLSSHWAIAPGWFLAGFILLGLFYWTTFRTQVPLFLSNRATVAALAALLPPTPARVLDAGAGTGSALRPLAAARPDCSFVGIEAAPAPWLIGRLMAGARANLAWRRGDFWAEDWSPYDVVYVFLSPVPMARVWAKATQEMRPGSRLISNSFEIPGVTPQQRVPADAAGGRPLFVYAPGTRTRTPEKGRKNASLPATPATPSPG
ncbi:MAG: class I SAM-dependent methyltransferase [Rhodocyclaceae bacterium]|nr:class I SAM-dependent methyltransferase [Rhodocyclaceae bacterium]MCB1964264.1 class I SAM-dependent methyltransferase [Rhodocyclaceae bacterium]